MERREKSLVAVNETVAAQPPVVLASGNEAVAGIADKLMKLSPSQRSFLRLRFYYESDGACATKIGVSTSTVKLWKKPGTDFLSAYEELLTQPLLHARAELLLLSQKAINVLGDLLDSPNPQTRLSAVEKVLKGRDVQLLTNNLKVEPGDGGDLYTALLQRLVSRKVAAGTVPTTVEPSDVVDAEFRQI